jgi:hypothetical protein
MTAFADKSQGDERDAPRAGSGRAAAAAPERHDPRSASPPGAMVSRSGLQRLQRAVGNNAMVRLVARQRTARPRAVLQRQVLSKLEIAQSEDDPSKYWVLDVVIGGRSPSPFSGTMGAHSTAWAAHIDEVRRALVNRSLPDAAAGLIELVEYRHKHDKLYAKRGTLAASHRNLLEAARAQLDKAMEDLDALREADPQDPVALQAGLRGLIDRYLTYVNYLPGATVMGGDTRTHGEGVARGKLTQAEYVIALHERQKIHASGDEASDLSDALAAVDATLKNAARDDFNRAKCAALTADLLKSFWTMFAVDTPSRFAAGRKDMKETDAWKLMLNDFLVTMLLAYPYVFDFLEMQLQARQLAGLTWALGNAKLAAQATVLACLPGDAIGEAFTRGTDQQPEVARSDLIGGGSAFKVTVLLDDTGAIGDVNMIGRTPSPFSGTMGAHSTAWIAHLDAVQTSLRGKPVKGAIQVLLERARGSLRDPALAFASVIDEKHQDRLFDAYQKLRGVIGGEPGGSVAAIEDIHFLERLVDAYLEFQNFLPMSTVSSGGVPGNRGEQTSRAVLVDYEEHGDAAFSPEELADKASILRGHLNAMYDPAALEAFPPAIVAREVQEWMVKGQFGYGPTHPLRRAFARNRRPPSRQAIARQRLYHVLMDAYPKSMSASGLLDSEHAKAAREADERSTEELRRLNEMLGQNNCLIHAIADAKDIALTYDQLFEIRLRIDDEVGAMLVATAPTIAIICEVLGIGGVIVVYQDDTPSESFGVEDGAAVIEHDGHLHFTPFRREEDREMGETDEAEKNEGEEEEEEAPLIGSVSPSPGDGGKDVVSRPLEKKRKAPDELVHGRVPPKPPGQSDNKDEPV